MEVSALRHPALPGLRGPAPLLRLQSDERLVALVRRGHQAAFETLVSRYQARLLAFCRHMLASREDAEDVLQEVFAAAFNAMLADEREINVRPWLYRIARNRSLNHLRRATAVGMDSMDIHFAEGGQSTSDKVFKREAFRQLMDDVAHLPESQRTALLLREMDALSYQEIAEAMETTIPSVKSLLVRARVSLGEAAESRRMSCDEVRLELGRVAEGLTRMGAPVRRHVRDCERCAGFRAALKANNRALAAVLPVAPLLLVKKLLLAKLGTTASAGGASAAGAGAGTAAVSGGTITAGGTLTAGLGALTTKAAAGLAAAAIVTAGAAVEVHQQGAATRHHSASSLATAQVREPTSYAHADPVVVASTPQPVRLSDRSASGRSSRPAPGQQAKAPATTKAPRLPAKPAGSALGPASATPAPATVQRGSDTTVLPSHPASPTDPGPTAGTAPKTPSGDPSATAAPPASSGSSPSGSSAPAAGSGGSGQAPAGSVPGQTPTVTGGSAQPPS